jgi:heme/copper-type cytochrome/quinol oxidase subunit 3
MYGARRAARRGHWPFTAAALRVAGVLALLTAVGVGIGWSDPALDAASGFGGIFYLTTGAHAVHLVIGSFFLGGLAVQAGRGRLAGSGRTLLDGTYWFWGFLVVVWLAIGVVFYLL